MAAYAEGLNIIANADMGKRQRDMDAETAPLERPELYQYEIDTTEVAEVWRRGSVVGSWLLDLTAQALQESPKLEEFAGRVSDSGEGRWTSIAAIEEGVPAPGADDGALLALRVAQHGRLREPAALRDAQAVRRPRREVGLMPLEIEVLPRRGRGRRARRSDRRRGSGRARSPPAIDSRSPSRAGARRGRCSRALDGRLPWEKVTIFQVDERIAPDGDPDRNLTQLQRSLPPGGAADVRAMPVWAEDLEAAAAAVRGCAPRSARSRAPRARPRRAHGLARARRSCARRDGSRRRRHRRLPGPDAHDADVPDAEPRSADPLARHGRGQGRRAAPAAGRRPVDPGRPGSPRRMRSSSPTPLRQDPAS